MNRPHGGHRQIFDDVRTATSPVTPQFEGPFVRPGLERSEPKTLVKLPCLGSLVGREADVNALVRRLNDVYMLTLTGPPGVGKSRLAVEVAHHIQASGVLGPVIVGVEPISSASELATTVEHALSEAEGDAPAERTERGGGPVVVVLDDCDHLLRECAHVAYVLLGRGVRVLATAREPLGVPGESTWRVPPLPVPPADSDEHVTRFTESAAVQLLCERAVHANRDFVATPDAAPAIAEICRRLDGVPLAIELAARTMTAYSAIDVVDHLDDPFSLLSSGPRSVHARHQSLWACLAWSYDLLSVPEQMVLEALAVFPGTFTGRAALDVCIPEGMAEPEFEEVLRALVDKSLVEVETLPGGARYHLLGMMRWFGLEKLAAGGEEAAQRDGHARWCARVVESAGDARRGRRWLARMEPVHHDIHAALEWALASGAAETAVALGEADVRLCRAQGRYGEARGRAHDLAAASAPPALRARAVTRAAMAEVAAGDVDGALGHLDEAVSLAAGTTDSTGLARAQLSLALARVLSIGRSALASLEAAVLAAREGWDRDLVIDAVNALGRARLLMGQPASAHDSFTESSELAADHADEVGQAQALVGLGAAGVLLGRYGDAQEALLPGLSLARAVGEGGSAALALAWLGDAARLQGKHEVADAWFVQAVDQAVAVDHPEATARALLGLGRLAAERGDETVAGSLFEDALATARGASLPYLVAPALCGLAELTSDAADAWSLVNEALGEAKSWGDQAGEALALEHVGHLTRLRGDLTGAATHHAQALALRAEIGDPAAIADSLDALAALAGERDDTVRAARLAGAADAVRDGHGCTRPARQRRELDTLVQSLRESLGASSFAAERRHGEALSPKSALAYAARQVGKRARRPTAGLEALTAAERGVANLVAEGLSNGQIARKLGTSPTTVKAHLRSVFAKVGVENRTALAVAIHRAGEEGR